jgi:hypothetical protein
MRDLAREGLPVVEVHGPEYPMTKILASALANEKR